MKNKKVVWIIILSVLVAVLGTLTFAPFSLTMNGDEVMEVEYMQPYEEPGAEGLLHLSDVRIEGQVDSSKPGEYTISYYYLGVKKTRTVKVVDKERPVITLLGYQELTLPINGAYQEMGYSAFDNVDGDLSDRVTVESELDTAEEGQYYITYSVTDNSGNRTRERRQITVTKDSPLTASLKDYDLNPYFSGTILAYTDEDTSEKMKDLVFFGDSIIGNLGFYDCIPINDHFWTRSSMTPDNIYTRIINVNCQAQGTFIDELQKRKPSDILILVGTGSMSSDSVEYFISCYEEMIKKMLEVSPDTHYIIVSILPVTDYFESAQNSRNDKINKVNYYLCELCQKYGMHFMNIAEALKDERGVGANNMYSDDHIHPSSTRGSRIIAEYIRTHLSY